MYYPLQVWNNVTKVDKKYPQKKKKKKKEVVDEWVGNLLPAPIIFIVLTSTMPEVHTQEKLSNSSYFRVKLALFQVF